MINYLKDEFLSEPTRIYAYLNSKNILVAIYLVGCVAAVHYIAIPILIIPPLVVCSLHYLASTCFGYYPNPKQKRDLNDLFLRLISPTESQENDSRPVFLFLRAKSDFNGALTKEALSRALSINHEDDHGVNDLTSRYNLILIDVGSTEEIVSSLERLNKEIKHVWIMAHGSPSFATLEGKKTLNTENIELLSDVMKRKIAPDAEVVLYSCSTGRKTSRMNLATKVSEMLPGRTIYAPKTRAGNAKLDLKENYSLNLKFYLRKSRLHCLIEHAWNILHFNPSKKIKMFANVTSKFKNGVECA